MFATIRKVALLAVVAFGLFCAPSIADAQSSPRNLANTVWVGGEDLTGRPTKLGFAFNADGSAIMIDDVTTGEVRGTWRQSGDQVVISFGNCEYRGRIQGNILVGTAQGTEPGARPWNFAVTYAPPSPVTKR